MDIWGALEELYKERQRLDDVIRQLEQLISGKAPSPVSRRGRKGMSQEERQVVSERMRKYWEKRRS